MAGIVAVAEKDVVAYLDAHPETVSAIATRVADALPPKKRCWVGVAGAAIGLALAAGAAVHAVPLDVGYLGGLILTAGSTLVAHFCPR